MIQYNTAKKILAMLWVLCAGFICVILLLQIRGGRFDGKVSEGWGWYCQNILPVLSIIITSFFSENNNAGKRFKVDAFTFYLALALSFFYLAVVTSILLFASEKMALYEWLQQSNVYLGAIQGIAASGVAMFFMKKSDSSKEANNDNVTP